VRLARVATTSSKRKRHKPDAGWHLQQPANNDDTGSWNQLPVMNQTAR